MGKRVFWGVLVFLGLWFLSSLADEAVPSLVVPSEPIYIGKPFVVTVNVPDTLIVLNLNASVKAYEFKMDKPGEIVLCFVRACDHSCECTPLERVIIANPGDKILFTLKNTPLSEEIRRTVLRAPEEPPEIQAGLVEHEGKCSLEITVTYPQADLTCESDQISATFYVQDPEKACEPIKLEEADPNTGVFKGMAAIELKYEKCKFIVRYCGKEVLTDLFPKAVVKVAGVEKNFELVGKLDEKVLAEIPEKIRPGDCCALALELIKERIKCHFETKPEVYIELIGGKLCVIVKDGCQYKVGVKDVEVLQPVRLVIKDESGQEVHGGRLEAGKTYTIEAINGLDEGWISVVELGSGEIIGGKAQKGATFEWMPEQAHTGKTFAIIYVDQYFCNPPALIVTVD